MAFWRAGRRLSGTGPRNVEGMFLLLSCSLIPSSPPHGFVLPLCILLQRSSSLVYDIPFCFNVFRRYPLADSSLTALQTKIPSTRSSPGSTSHLFDRRKHNAAKVDPLHLRKWQIPPLT